MRRSQYENRRLDDAIDRLLAIKPVETEAEELVEKCAAVRIAVGSVLSKEIEEFVGEKSVPRRVLMDGHWAATELLYWAATVYRPEVWSVLTSDPHFARIAFLPLEETFHGAETAFGPIVWASHADPATLTERDIDMMRANYLQVSVCFSRMTWKLAAIFEVLEKFWDDNNVARKGYGHDDIYFASRLYDVLRSSAGEEGCGNDYRDEMIEYRINDARTAFAQIAIQGLLIRGLPVRAWEHLLEPLFTRWFTETQSLYTAAQVAEIAEVLRGGEELPQSITSRYSESELAVARTAIKIDITEGTNDNQ